MPTPANYSWIPSTARVVALSGCGPMPRGAPSLTPCQLAWPPKDPGDTLDFVLDITDAIAGNEGDAISTLDIVISPNYPGDLTLESASADGGLAILWLSAGFAGTTYAVTMTMRTNSGRMLARTVNLPVVAMATPPAPPGSLTDQTGAPITTQANQPIFTTP